MFNPMAEWNKILQSHPELKNVDINNPQQMQQVAQQICNQRGININEAINQMKNSPIGAMLNQFGNMK